MSIKKQQTILIVDDEFSIRDSLKLYLEDYDFNVKTAESAEEALLLTVKYNFNVAVVDLRLPGIPGDEFILELKKVQPNIKILIHTGSTEYELPLSLKTLGVQNHHVIIKPIPDLIFLVQLIKQLIAETD